MPCVEKAYDPRLIYAPNCSNGDKSSVPRRLKNTYSRIKVDLLNKQRKVYLASGKTRRSFWIGRDHGEKLTNEELTHTQRHTRHLSIMELIRSSKKLEKCDSSYGNRSRLSIAPQLPERFIWGAQNLGMFL